MTMNKRLFVRGVAALAAVPAMALFLAAAPGAARAQGAEVGDTVVLGTLAPLSGPATALSVYARQMAAYFEAVNDAGGVRMGDGKTRKVTLKIVDDGGQPARAAAGARELVERDKVFAIVGAFGTNQNLAINDYLNQRKVPNVFVLSAASIWGRDIARSPWTIGLPPTSGTQAAVFAAHLRETKPQAKIAVLHGNDEYGKGALEQVRSALKGSAASVVSAESYEPTDATLDAQVVKMAGSGADVWINFAIGRPAVQSLQKARELGWNPQRYVDVASSSSGLLKQLKPEVADGILSAAYIKDPTDAGAANDPALVFYQQAMARHYGAGFDATGQPLGATIALAVVDVLKKLPVVTREAFMAAVKEMKEQDNALLLPGIRFNTSASSAFPVTQLQLIQLQGGSWKKVGDVRRGAPL